MIRTVVSIPIAAMNKSFFSSVDTRNFVIYIVFLI